MNYARQRARLATPPQTVTASPDIILDSGAYSVWRSGAKVDLPRYIAYCDTVSDCTLTCVNLDVIPGAWGARATEEDVELACVESYARWIHLSLETKAMIMPVYHQGDPIKWLDRYLEAGALYIGISPTDSFSAAVRQPWLHQVHEYINRCGVTLNKDVFTHCLGVFAPRILYDLPAWSADASTLLRYVAMKRILIPQLDHKNRIRAWRAVPVSSRAGVVQDPVDWDMVAEYCQAAGVKWERPGGFGRVVVDEPDDIILVNLLIAHKATLDTGVRCFVAGQHPLAIYTVTMSQYPYILRSYAVIKERHGNTIRNIYHRNYPKPNRRPEKDRKVAPPRGLFTL